MSEHQDYLAVLKASYDYEPQSEDEVAMKEDQILFLIEKTDDDWWRVKIKGDHSDDDTPVGLVPAAYVEQAEHSSIVKALYDYEATSPDELSIKEDDTLLAFDQEDDWLLVQSKEDGGKAGFVPANYVEPNDEDQSNSSSVSPPIIVPQPSIRPVNTYVDPEDRVRASKAKSDDIQTWALSEVDKKGKKKKGTLGVGNGAVFFASESDKTPVQKWQTSHIQGITIEKSKHLHIDVGGPSPVKLHFNAGSKDTADAILVKLESSKQYSGTSPGSSPKDDLSSVHSPSISSPREGTSISSTTSTGQLRKLPPKSGILMKKKAVVFSPDSPVLIPPRIPSEDDEQTFIGGDHAAGDYSDAGEMAQHMIALYDFDADGDDELSVRQGEELIVLEADGDEWRKCRNASGAEGVVPASYLDISDVRVKSPISETPTNGDAVDREARTREQLEERERVASELAEKRHVELQALERERQKLEREIRTKTATGKQRQDTASRKVPPVVNGAQPNPSSSTSSPAESKANAGTSSKGRSTSETKGVPPPESTRIWHDRTGQFRVEAAFLGFVNGKIRLHKANGVIVEVPAEKMSAEDMRYVDKLSSKRPASSSAKLPSDDDVPLAVLKNDIPRGSSSRPPPTTKPKAPGIDWFDFFLSAGCEVDDCTRYASAFERDKIDQAILLDITESTMRSLGLREGDIIRITKAIQQRKPKAVNVNEQLRLDEELAARLQAEENENAVRQGTSPAPNIFAGPQGALKNQRRGRPQPSKSLPPPSVDLDAISTASDHMQRTTSPQIASSSSAPVHPPPRTSSTLSPNGFEDDAWTNRPSSARPITSTPTVTAARAPSAPPASATTTASSSQATPAGTQNTGSNLAKTTESDVFDQLARLAELRKSTSPTIASASNPPAYNPPVPSGFQSGLGMGSSSLPIGQHVQNQQSGFLSSANAPRGPFAPVPVNQALLQPLIPTTSFSSFVPTRPGYITPFQNQPFSGPMAAGFQVPQTTGYPISQPMLPQPTGMPGGGSFVQSNPTGYNLSFTQSPFNNAPPPVPQLPPSANTSSASTSPANVFAQMKSGTFASGDENKNAQPPEKYDTLRPTVPLQPTGWGYQNGYTGY